LDIGYFDSRMRLNPPLRQQRDRDALRAGLADGTIDALVSDHTPVSEDEKTLPFAESVPGATGLELLLSMALKWAQQDGIPLSRAIATVTLQPARLLEGPGSTVVDGRGTLAPGGVADVCVLDPRVTWIANATNLRSQSHLTPFGNHEMAGAVRATLVNGRVAFHA
jgi:dihydroorotase